MTDEHAQKPSANLFTPEAMAQIQADVSKKLHDDYLHNNFIPTPENTGMDCFARIMKALRLGIIANPKDALFFDAQVVCTIVQIVAPTMFITPGIAALVDAHCFDMLAQADRLNAALLEYSQEKYLMSPSGETLEKPDTEESEQAKAVLFELCAAYAAHVAATLFILERATYPTNAIFPDSRYGAITGYRSAALMQKILTEGSSPVDRALYKGLTDFTVSFTKKVCVPPILGLDVLQLLASMAEESNAMSHTVLAALMLTFGVKAVSVNQEGEIIIAEEHSSIVRKTLWPHRKWFTEFLNENTLQYPIQCHGGELVNNCQHVTVRDLDYATVIREDGDLGVLLCGGLNTLMAEGKPIPMPSAPQEGEVLVVVSPEVALKVQQYQSKMQSVVKEFIDYVVFEPKLEVGFVTEPVPNDPFQKRYQNVGAVTDDASNSPEIIYRLNDGQSVTVLKPITLNQVIAGPGGFPTIALKPFEVLVGSVITKIEGSPAYNSLRITSPF